MPLNNRHYIRSLLFDLVFDDERRARELYDDVRHLHYTTLEKIICQCLDQFADPQTCTQLESLELDLGPIHYRDLDGQLAQRLFEALSEKLQLLFIDQAKRPIAKHAPNPSRIDLICHFLKTGYLPWNTKEDVGSLLQSVLAEEPALMAAALRRIGTDQNIRQRLVTRLTPALLEQLIHALEPEKSLLILQFYRRLIRLMLGGKLINQDKQQLEKMVWLFVFNYLLLRPGSAIRIASLIREVLTQFALHFEKPFAPLVLLFIDELNRQQEVEYAVLLNIFAEISAALPREATRSAQPARQFIQLTAQERTRLLWQLLQGQALYPYTHGLQSDYLQNHFERLLKHDSAAVRNFLRQSKKTSEITKNIVRHFDNRIVLELIRQFESGHSQVIINYHKNLLTLQQKEPLVAMAGKAFANDLWEMILQLLIARRDTYFNQKAFLKQLIGHLSAHYNLNYHELLRQLYRVARSLSVEPTRLPVFIQMIQEIQEEESGSWSTLSPAEGVKQSVDDQKDPGIRSKAEGKPKLSDQQACLLLLRQYLRSGVSAQQLDDLRLFIRQMLPVQPHVLVQEIQAPEVPADAIGRLTRDFDLTILQGLIHGLEPTHYQSILQYQNHIIRVQRAQPVLQAGELQLSTIIWQLVLQILLSRSSSRFNRKAFLKKLLQQTAAHYHSDYRQLLDQLYLAARLVPSRSGNFEVFLQLVVEIRADEGDRAVAKTRALTTPKAGEAANGEDPLSAKGDLVTPATLVKLIIRSARDLQPQLAAYGFKDTTEAFDYLRLYHGQTLIACLQQESRMVQVDFLKKIPDENQEQLLQLFQDQKPTPVYSLLAALHQRLKLAGFAQQAPLMQQVRREGLLYLLAGSPGVWDHLLEKLEKILGRYPLPASFFEVAPSWQLPASGALDEQIEQMEIWFSQSLQGEQAGISNAKHLLQTLSEPQGKKPDRVPFFKIEEEIMEEEIYINNAGLVILNGYLSYFFDRCGLFAERGFVGPDAAARAACLLQYVYDPANTYGEEALVLNKLLCGLPLSTVLPADFEATELEKEVTGQMLDAVISHWEIIKNSTREGFRESWLWREGKLSRGEKGWELLIEQRPFDVLLDYIPFSISPVQFSWMELPIKVIWR